MSTVLTFPTPHRISTWRGATPADVVHTRQQVDLCFDLFVSALAGQLGNLQDHLPVGELPEFDEWFGRIADLRGDIIGKLMQVEDRS